MIRVENVDVYGWAAAIRGMRNPHNSWPKSDSVLCYGYFSHLCDNCKYAIRDDKDSFSGCTRKMDEPIFAVGPNDLKRMRSLAKAGNDHAKFARMINVACDITAPLYWWKEFKTYRAGRKFADEEPDLIPCDCFETEIEMNSCSTMHKIDAKEFTLGDFSHEHLIDYDDEVNCFIWKSDDSFAKDTLEHTICALNYYRERFLETEDKHYWWQMIQLLPSSYNQKRTIQLNYQVLWSMYRARKNHKLDEWRDFCKWIEGLPYFKEIYLND